MHRSENAVDSLRMRFVNRLIATAVLMLASATAAAQSTTQTETPSPQTPERLTGTTVLKRYVDALGGAEAVFAIERRELRGTYEGPGFDYIARLVMRYESPNSLHLTIRNPVGETYELMHTPEATWESGLGLPGPTHVRNPLRRLIIKEDADLYQEANYAERYAQIVLRGMNTFDGRNLLEVLAAPAPNTGRPKFLYFDPETFLLEGYVTVSYDGEKQARVFVTLKDYKEFESVKFPTRTEIRFEGSDDVAVYTTDAMIINGEPYGFTIPESLPPFESAAELSDQSDEAVDADEPDEE
ncbi:MAG: hypothetical protein AAF235_09815 [Planctomycetota bacterium]